MKRNFKALGLALLAAFAMSAVVASGASATGEDLFHSEAHTTFLDSEGTVDALGVGQLFHNATGKVNCKKVTTTASISGTTVSEITVTPVYSECKVTVGGSELEGKVEFTTCDYLFTGETKGTHSQVHVQCTNPSDHIHIKVFILGAFRSCFTIPDQTPTSGGVVYTNQGTGKTRDIEIDATVEGIEYTKEGVCGSGVANDATYSGKVTVKGTDAEKQHVGIWFT